MAHTIIEHGEAMNCRVSWAVFANSHTPEMMAHVEVEQEQGFTAEFVANDVPIDYGCKLEMYCNAIAHLMETPYLSAEEVIKISDEICKN